MAPVKLGSFLITNCCLLLAAVLTSWQSTAQASRLLSAFQQATDFYETGSQPMIIIRAELLHRDHPLSPLAPTEGTTFGDRLAAAAKRSHNRHQLLMTRGRRLAAFQTPVEFKGTTGGEYVMSISFGTPPQHFTGLIDTGSDFTWVQCIPCASCFPPIHGHPNAPYDPDASSSEVFVPCSDVTVCDPDIYPIFETCKDSSQHCKVKYGYLDGSAIEGALTMETVTLTNTAGPAASQTGFRMGCMNNNTGVFDNYDGIIGFSRGLNSLPTQLSIKGNLEVFAHCLVPYAATTTFTSSLIFGTRDNTQGLVYTPLLPIEETLYWVGIVGASVEGVDLGLDPVLFRHDATANTGGVIFDSGTTSTYLAKPIYDAIRKEIHRQLISRNFRIVSDEDNGSFCFDTVGVQATMPLVTFHMAGTTAGTVVDFALEWDNVYVPQNAIGDTVLCLSFGWNDSGGTMIMGNFVQANHYIEFDVVNMVMGWKSKDCTVS